MLVEFHFVHSLSNISSLYIVLSACLLSVLVYHTPYRYCNNYFIMTIIIRVCRITRNITCFHWLQIKILLFRLIHRKFFLGGYYPEGIIPVAVSAKELLNIASILGV